MNDVMLNFEIGKYVKLKLKTTSNNIEKKKKNIRYFIWCLMKSSAAPPLSHLSLVQQ